jgi:hypothetical protein
MRCSQANAGRIIAVLIASIVFLLSLYRGAVTPVSAQSRSAAASPQFTNAAPQQTPYQALLADGWHTTPEAASKLEAQLERDPDNVGIRATLISYYTQYIIPEPRAKHVLWLIEHHPDADIFSIAAGLTSTAPHYAGLNSPETIERGRTLWLAQAERLSSNSKVLANAAMALASSDSMAALDLIRRARRAEPANSEWVNWLGAIYARAVRASFAGGPDKLHGMSAQSADRNARDGFAVPAAESEALKAELETSTDVELLRAAGQALVFESRVLTSASAGIPRIATGSEEYAASGAFGERLLQRAKDIAK